MKVEKQQTAIAKVCNDLFFRNAENVWCFMSPELGLIEWDINDLNACHEMEKVLDYEQCEAFSNMLPPPNENREKDYAFPWSFARIHTTAAERCEAFLLVMGLWEEEANEPRTEEADVATVIPDPLADMRARAEAGDRHAQCTLGDAYAHGMEVAQDRVESDRWYAMFNAPFPTEEEQ